MKSHFLALLSPEFDGDMLEHWIGYYTACKFDDYFVFLHSPVSSERSDDILHFTRRKLARYGVNSSIIRGPFNSGALRAECFKIMVQSFDKNDTVITADSDEIHEIDPREYRNLIEQYDLLEGALVDRYGQGLAKALPEIPLEVQYPEKGKLQELLFAGFFMQPTKILASRCWITVDFLGSHNTVDIYSRLPLPKIAGIYEVSHYRWRESILLRMALRDYYTVEHMMAVCKHFNIPIYERPEFDIKRKRLNALKNLEALATQPLAPVSEGMKDFATGTEIENPTRVPLHRPALFTEGR